MVLDLGGRHVAYLICEVHRIGGKVDVENSAGCQRQQNVTRSDETFVGEYEASRPRTLQCEKGESLNYLCFPQIILGWLCSVLQGSAFRYESFGSGLWRCGEEIMS